MANNKREETEEEVWPQICSLLEIDKCRFNELQHRPLVELLKEVRDKIFENLMGGAGYRNLEEAIKYNPWVREYVKERQEFIVDELACNPKFFESDPEFKEYLATHPEIIKESAIIIKIGERYKLLGTFVDGDKEFPPQTILSVIAVKDGYIELESDKGIKTSVPNRYIDKMSWVQIVEN
jgi:hypothetical protein